MKSRVVIALSVIFCWTIAMAVFAQDPGAPRTPGRPGGDKFFGKKDPKPENARSVEGKVLDPVEDLVEGAVVQLKDTKTLRIRSYVTLEDGGYRFHGLSTETDYELKATHEDRSSKVRRLTVYDSRKKATINLKLKPKA